MACKVREIFQYTETVYYDDDGTVVARDRNHDDHLYDSYPPEDLTQQEMEDYFDA